MKHTKGILDRNPNGDCIYLKDSKCEIWDSRPVICKNYWCGSDGRITDSDRKIS